MKISILEFITEHFGANHGTIIDKVEKCYDGVSVKLRIDSAIETDTIEITLDNEMLSYINEIAYKENND